MFVSALGCTLLACAAMQVECVRQWRMPYTYGSWMQACPHAPHGSAGKARPIASKTIYESWYFGPIQPPPSPTQKKKKKPPKVSLLHIKHNTIQYVWYLNWFPDVNRFWYSNWFPDVNWFWYSNWFSNGSRLLKYMYIDEEEFLFSLFIGLTPGTFKICTGEGLQPQPPIIIVAGPTSEKSYQC